MNERRIQGPPPPDPSIAEALHDIMRKTYLMVKRYEEKEARETLLEWLPRYLKWLADHQKLLKWYIRLPHRTQIVGIRSGVTGVTQYVIRDKSFMDMICKAEKVSG